LFLLRFLDAEVVAAAGRVLLELLEEPEARAEMGLLPLLPGFLSLMPVAGAALLVTVLQFSRGALAAGEVEEGLEATARTNWAAAAAVLE
jgi:hypothetical protein